MAFGSSTGGEAIGIMQVIDKPGNTMRTFHTDCVAGDDITQVSLVLRNFLKLESRKDLPLSLSLAV